MMSSGKRKRDDYAPHLTSSGQMPQQDGSGDVMIEFFLPEVLKISRTLTCTIVSCIFSPFLSPLNLPLVTFLLTSLPT